MWLYMTVNMTVIVLDRNGNCTSGYDRELLTRIDDRFFRDGNKNRYQQW